MDLTYCANCEPWVHRRPYVAVPCANHRGSVWFVAASATPPRGEIRGATRAAVTRPRPMTPRDFESELSYRRARLRNYTAEHPVRNEPVRAPAEPVWGPHLRRTLFNPKRTLIA